MCSNLESGLLCARHNLEGCLPSQVEQAQTLVEGIDGLAVEIEYCGIDSTIVDYSSACKAEEPCSIRDALECLKLEEGDDPSDCE